MPNFLPIPAVMALLLSSCFADTTPPANNLLERQSGEVQLTLQKLPAGSKVWGRVTNGRDTFHLGTDDNGADQAGLYVSSVILPWFSDDYSFLLAADLDGDGSWSAGDGLVYRAAAKFGSAGDGLYDWSVRYAGFTFEAGELSALTAGQLTNNRSDAVRCLFNPAGMAGLTKTALRLNRYNNRRRLDVWATSFSAAALSDTALYLSAGEWHGSCLVDLDGDNFTDREEEVVPVAQFTVTDGAAFTVVLD